MGETKLNDLPELDRLFGYLPLRYGCFIIGLFGLVSNYFASKLGFVCYIILVYF